MYRQNGPIPTIENDKYPRRLVVFDTEAYRGEVINNVEAQSFRMGVSRFIELNDNLSIVTDEIQYYDKPIELYSYLDYLTRKDTSLFVYAHNIKYDLQLSGILTHFISNGWSVNAFVFDDPPTFMRLKRFRSSIMFVDTFNYWQTSLAKMGEQLGLDKLSMPTGDAPLDSWKVYCKRDVDVLTEYLLSFIRYLKDNNLCGMGLTLASQAFRTYRHRFMKHTITLHNRKEATQVERDGYTGGRVEAFYIGTLPRQPYYKLDVNSMYPFVMKEKLYPYEFIAYTENIPTSKLDKLLDKYYLIGHFDITTNEACYAYKGEHKLIFPVGNYQAVLHQDEIYHALIRGHINSVLSLVAYKKGDIFSDYINYFYDMKIQAEVDHNPVIRHQAKIFMNSLYGKFGQMNNVSKIVDNQTDTQYGRITGYSQSLHKHVEINCLGPQMEVSYRDGESTYSFPGIAGAVTAYARLYLWKLINTAGSKHVFYCDTDSLMVDQTGMDALSSYLDDTKLGYMKIEGVSDKVIIYGAKDYQFNQEVKHKGVPKSANEIVPGKWEYQQFRGAKTWLSDGMTEGVNVYTKVKERKSIYDKGIIQPDNSVLPVILGTGGKR